MTTRALKIGEVRQLTEAGEIAKTRKGGSVSFVETDAIVAGEQVEKLIRLCDDPVTDTHSLDLAIKAAREARLCLTRAEKALKTVRDMG